MQDELHIRAKDFDDYEYSIKPVEVAIFPDDFLKIKETLERVGIYSAASKTLWQSAHILHKRGRYYITHFKELFALDGKAVEFTDEDMLRRNVIISLLVKWDLLDVVNDEDQKIIDGLLELEKLPVKLRVIPFKSKRDFNLKSKYAIGE